MNEGTKKIVDLNEVALTENGRGVVNPSDPTPSNFQHMHWVECAVDGTYVNYSNITANAGNILRYNREIAAWQRVQVDGGSLSILDNDLDADGHKITGLVAGNAAGEAATFEQVELKISKTIGRNLLNPDSQWAGKYIYYENGSYGGPSPNSLYFTSEFIPIDEDGLYVNKAFTSESGIVFHIYYNSSFSPIAHVRTQYLPFITDAAYVRICLYTSKLEGLQVEVGSAATAFVNFNLSGGLKTDQGNTNEVGISILNAEFESLNAEFESLNAEFESAFAYDSLTDVISRTSTSIQTWSDIAGAGGNYTKAGVTFNAIRLAGAKRGTVPENRKWSFGQVVIKDTKESTIILAKSPLIPVDKELAELGEIIFPLMDSNLENFISLNDDSFAGSTYFVCHVWYNADLSYAFGGSTAGSMLNYSGTSFYTTNDVLTTWSVWSSNPSPALEHVFLSNIQPYKRLVRLDERLTTIEEIVSNEIGSIELTLPSIIDMVVNDTLQLYYASMIPVPNPDNFHFAATLSGAKDLKRYIEFTPTTAGDRTITIELYDHKGLLLDTKTSTIRVRAAIQSPATELNFWTVGDSLTANPEYTNEMVRRLTGTGGTPAGNEFTNIVNHRIGNSGKTWNWYVTNEDSPFVYSGVINLAQYLIDNSLSTPDVIYILLTWNGMGSNRTMLEWDTWDNDVYTLIDAFKAAFPDVEVKLISPQFPSQTGGLGYVDGASISGYPNTLVQNRNAIQQAVIYERISKETGYSTWVEHIQSALQVDSLYNMPFMNKPVNTRNAAITEMIGINDVHPSTEGYLQIADALYRNFIVNYCQ